MNCALRTTFWVSGYALVAGLVGVALTVLNPVETHAASNHALEFDVAVDCRTFAGGDNRSDVFVLNGKLFPVGTLPVGVASNDPTQPVNRIPPVGDWLLRGQHAFPFPPAVAASYSSVPLDFATQYYILDARRALIAEVYAFPTLEGFGALTGGVGEFSGASGDVHGVPIGTNATGCPNFRAKFRLQPGSVRGGPDR